MKQVLIRSVRSLWWTLATAIIVVAVAVQTGRLMAPMLHGVQDRVTEAVAEQLDSNVQIGSIKARWTALRPEIVISSIDISDSDQNGLLSIGTAVAQVDLLQSLIDRRLRLWNLEVLRANLHFYQSEDGWLYAGSNQVASNTPVTSSREVDDPLDIFLLARIIDIDDANIHLHFVDGTDSSVGLSRVLLQNDGEFHRLSARVDIADRPEVVSLAFEGIGDPRASDQFSGKGYLGLYQFPLGLFDQALPTNLSQRDVLGSSLVNGRLWLNLQPEGLGEVVGEVSVSEQASGQPLRTYLDSHVLASFDGLSNWAVDLQRLSIKHPESDRPLLSDQDIRVTAGSERELNIAGADLDIGSTVTELIGNGLIPSKVGDVLADLAPSGFADAWQVKVPLDDLLSTELVASVRDVSISPRKGIPGLTGITGYVEAKGLSGTITVDTERRSSLYIPSVYGWPLEFETLEGQVRWSVDVDENQVLIYSGPLSVSGPAESATGVFYLDVPFRAKSRPGELYLQIGVTDAPVESHKMFVPSTLPSSLLEWLDQALVEGHVSSAGFLFRSYIGKERPPGRTTQLALEVEDGELKFLESWPSAESLLATVELDNQRVTADVSEGTLLNSAFHQVSLTVDDNPAGEGDLLSLSGNVEGPSRDLLSLLIETPISEFIPDRLSKWSLDGSMFGELLLDIPLKPNQPGMRQQIVATVSDSSLFMPELDLTFEAINGVINFDSTNGLSSDKLNLTFWDLPVSASIASRDWGRGTPESAINIVYDGLLNPHVLANWSRRPELYFVSGDLEVRGELSVPLVSDVPFTLRANSDISSIALELPPPFNKEVGESSGLKFEMSALGDRSEFNVAIGDPELGQSSPSTVVGKIVQDEQSIYGVITNTSLPRELPSAQIVLAAGVDSVDAEQWLSVINTYQSFQQIVDEQHSSGLPASNASGSSKTTELILDIYSGEFNWGAVVLEDMGLAGRLLDQGQWQFDVTSSLADGQIIWSSLEQPVVVDLQRLTLDFSESDNAASEASSSGVLDNLTPDDLLAIDFNAQAIILNGEDYGRWAFKLRPEKNAFWFRDVLASSRGLDIDGDLQWSKSDTFEYSFFDGAISGGNLEKTFAAWGLEPVIQNDRVDLGAKLVWMGSPLDLKLAKLNGNASLKIVDGKFNTSGQAQASTDLLRLLGLFNFDSWLRRLRLDFSDVYESGMAFDQFYGDLVFGNGSLYLETPIKIDTPSAKMSIGGVIDLEDETLDSTLVVTLPIAGNATTMAALVAGLPIAAGVYVINKLLDTQVEQLTSASYTVDGAWASPNVKFNRLFDRDAAKEAGKRASGKRVEEAIKDAASP